MKIGNLGGFVVFGFVLICGFGWRRVRWFLKTEVAFQGAEHRIALVRRHAPPLFEHLAVLV
jgi:hypothetical protein